jgi:hypothetical protein
MEDVFKQLTSASSEFLGLYEVHVPIWLPGVRLVGLRVRSADDTPTCRAEHLQLQGTCRVTKSLNISKALQRRLCGRSSVCFPTPSKYLSDSHITGTRRGCFFLKQSGTVPENGISPSWTASHVEVPCRAPAGKVCLRRQRSPPW